MDVRPMKRIWPSLISVRRLNVSRHSVGTRKGSTPSITSMSATAVSKVLLTGFAGYGERAADACPPLISPQACRPI